MFNLRKFFAVLFFVALLFPLAGQAANPVEVYFFEGQGCPHCAKMKSYLEGLKVDYPNLTVKDFEVYFDKDSQDLFQRMLAAYNSDVNGVPVIFVGEEVVVGEDYGKLRDAVEKCSNEECVSPSQKLEAAVNTNTNVDNGNDNININTNQPTTDGPEKNEVVGWVVIGVFVVVGVGLIIYMLKGKK